MALNEYLAMLPSKQSQTKPTHKPKITIFKLQTQKLVGLGRFELPSRAPEAQSLDQASRQPQTPNPDTVKHNSPANHKNLNQNPTFKQSPLRKQLTLSSTE